MIKKGFAANTVLEGTGFFLAVFLILVVLIPFILLPSPGHADETESIALVEGTLTWATDTGKSQVEQPISIEKDNYLVSFNKGEWELEGAAECDIRESCLCICEDESCYSPIKCVGFEQFDVIRYKEGGSEVNKRSFKGDGKVINLQMTISSLDGKDTLWVNKRD